MKIQYFRQFVVFQCTCAFLLFCASAAQTETNTWIGPSTGLWNTTTNWNPRRVPLGADTIQFSRKSGTFYVSLDCSPTLYSVLFDNSAYWRLTGPDKTLTVTKLLSLSGNSTATEQYIEPAVAGGCSVLIDQGWMHFKNACAFTGAVTVARCGILEAQAQTAAPFGTSNIAVTLYGGSFALDGTNANTVTTAGVVNVSTSGKLEVDAAGFSATTVLSVASLSMTGDSRDPAAPGYRRAVLFVNGATDKLGTLERVTVAGGMPDLENGALPAWYIASPNTGGLDAGDGQGQHLTYNSTTGFAKFTNYIIAVDTWSNVGTGGDQLVKATSNTSISGSKSVYGFVNANGNINVGQAIADLSIGRGGLFFQRVINNNPPINRLNANVDFGTNEAVIFVCGITTYAYDRNAEVAGNITGSKGITFCGPGLFYRPQAQTFNGITGGPITILGTRVAITAGSTYSYNWVLDCGTFQTYFKGDTGLSGSIKLMNGGGTVFLNGYTGLGAHTLTLSGYITGPGRLTIDNSEAKAAITCSSNDYSGGTYIIAPYLCTATTSNSLGSGPIALASNAQLTLNAAVDQDWLFTSGISGAGTLNVESGSNTACKVTFAGSTVSPGDDLNPGTLTVNGKLELNSTGSTNCALLINVYATNSHDKLVVNGSLVSLLNANIQVALGYTPDQSDVFSVVINDGDDPISGTFKNVSSLGILHVLNSNYRCKVRYNGNADGGSTANDIELYDFVYLIPGTLVMVR